MERVNGTLIASYYACHRELWYMAHAIIPDEEHDFLELGRLVGKIFLRRGRKKILLGDIKPSPNRPHQRRKRGFSRRRD